MGRVKSKQVSVTIYEFHTESFGYIRVHTEYRIVPDSNTPDLIFKHATKNVVDIKDKLFMMRIKNLEGVDESFYSIKTNVDRDITKVIKIGPDTINMS